MTKEELEKKLASVTDAGKEPSSVAFTDDQRRLISQALATNAAVAQFVIEGIIPEDEQSHFAVHVMDFAARLYAGESITLPNISATIVTDSLIGELFLDATNEALKNGKILRKDEKTVSPETNKRLN